VEGPPGNRGRRLPPAAEPTAAPQFSQARLKPEEPDEIDRHFLAVTSKSRMGGK
jgi:hypothetical protein